MNFIGSVLIYYFTVLVTKCYSCDIQEDRIYCSGSGYWYGNDLRSYFSLLSSQLDETQKHFKEFYFINTAITELVSNVFDEITFDVIRIRYASNLTKIHKNAFNSTSNNVKEFDIQHTPVVDMTDEYNMFTAINDMSNVELVRIRDIRISFIPSNAFTALNKLENLFIYYNNELKTLGSNAFYELNNLLWVDLSGNPIDYIPENAFSFHYSNNVSLSIDFAEMPNLDSKSFTVKAFTDVKRKFRLNFVQDFKIKYLHESVFDPVLSQGNEISMVNTYLECDCRMYWLYKKKSIYQDLLRFAYCYDQNSVFTFSYKNCTE